MTRVLILSLAALAALPCAFAADEPAAAVPALTPEQKTIADNANAFIAAYNKGDFKALAAMFAEDAEWVNDDGNVLSGRDAISANLKSALQISKGRTLDIDVESVRPLTADVMLEKGTSVVTDPDGRNAVTSYTAVHVKKGDAWVISQLTETGSPIAGNAARQLSELDWLVGSWVDNVDNVEVKTTVEWAANGNFLTRKFSVKGEDDSTGGTEVIGWDPSLGKIRSWVFESDGSFSEKVWTTDGRRWLIQSRTVLADGGQGTEEQTLTFVDKDKFTWSAASRQVDGESLPNINPITVVRAK